MNLYSRDDMFLTVSVLLCVVGIIALFLKGER